MPKKMRAPPKSAFGASPKKVTEVRRLAWNAESPMLVTELPIVTVVRELRKNAEPPMLVTVLGMVKATKDCVLNASLPIVVTK